MFPGAHAQVHTNEAGEPIGWDYPDADDPYDPDDFLPEPDWCEEHQQHDCGEDHEEDDGET